MTSRPWHWIWLCICISVTPVGAQQSLQKSVTRHQFPLNIPSQPLADALNSFSRQTHLKLAFYTELGRGLISPRIDGNYTPDSALRLLLANTGLRFKYIDPDSVAILPSEPGASSPVNTSAISTRLASGSDAGAAAPSVPGTGNSELGTDRSGLKTSDPNQTDTDREHNKETEREPESNKHQTGTLDDIVVTAQKREERLQDVPISISVLSGENLDKSPFQGVTEALNTVPGVAAFPWSQGGGTFVAVRGVTASYPLFGGSSPIAYYLDGVPFGLVDTAIAPDANAYDLKRVEVLRGPQGTLYGASALNGVVRVLTNDADLNSFDFKARGSDSVTNGGGNNYRGDMAVNVPIIDGKLAARAVLGYESLSGWIDKPNKNNANDAVLRNARLKVNAQPTDELSIGLSAWLSRQNYGAPSIANDQGRTNHLVPEPISTDFGAYNLKFGYEFPGVSVTSMTSYLKYTSHDELDFIDFIGLSYPILESFGAHVFSEEVNLNSTQNGPWRWSAGAIYRDAENATFQTLPAIATLDWTDASRSAAIFGELSRRLLNDTMECTVGGRYFRDDVTTKEGPYVPPLNPPQYYRAKASFNATTPRAVLTWHPANNSTIYSSYSEGFRSGAPQTYYITGGVPGFPAVKPDKLHNYEIGAKADLFDKRISVDTALYFMDWKDVQQEVLVPFHSVNVGALVNGQSASGPGVDVGVTTRPFDKVEVGVTFSWNDLTLDNDVISAGKVLFAKGDRLNFSAKYTAGASANYVFPLGGSGFEGRLSVSGNYSSPLSDRGIVGGAERTAVGDAMLIARTGVSIHAPGHWEVAIFADNITNEQGAVSRNPFDLSPVPNTSVRVRPRTVGLQFDYRHK
jgi:iron complex outermembrane receptor protein